MSSGLRALVPSDKPAIDVINNITYGGHDYISACFPGWMERQGKDLWSQCIADAEGVAGLEVLTLYDQGRTGWLDALRVHPRAQGQGESDLQPPKHTDPDLFRLIH